MEYTEGKKIIRRKWTASQVKSLQHWLALLAFGFLSVAPFPVVLTIVVGISVVAGILRIPSLIGMAILVSLVTAFFPPLAGIVSIVFLLMKLAYIVKHFRALFLGTGLIAYLLYFSAFHSPFPTLLYDLTGYFPPIQFSTLHFVVSALLFHLVLLYLYTREYSTKEAVLIMGTVPLFLFMLILPFLLQQLEELGETFEGESFDEYEQHYYEENPDTHTVRGHIRQNADGSTSTVRPHIRSNPDGTEMNNLSHRK